MMKIRLPEFYDVLSRNPNSIVRDLLESAVFDYENNVVEIEHEKFNNLIHNESVIKTIKDDPPTKPELNEGSLESPISVSGMIKSAAKAAVDWTRSGFEVVPKHTLDTRLEVCMGCEFWDKKGFAGGGKCKKCGCSTQAKLRMATEKCPIGKW